MEEIKTLSIAEQIMCLEWVRMQVMRWDDAFVEKPISRYIADYLYYEHNLYINSNHVVELVPVFTFRRQKNYKEFLKRSDRENNSPSCRSNVILFLEDMIEELLELQQELENSKKYEDIESERIKDWVAALPEDGKNRIAYLNWAISELEKQLTAEQSPAKPEKI